MIQYIFPYDRIPTKSRVVIYGFGEVGMDYLKQILTTNYCEVVGIIDKKWEDYRDVKCPVYPCTKLREIRFDYVVLAFKTEIHMREVINQIRNQGVDEKKIIIPTIKEVSIYNRDKTEMESMGLAYKKTDIAIAVTLKGGIGDCISNAPLIYMLIKELPNCLIDLVGVKNKAFLTFLFCECKNINVITKRIIDEKGYDLSISIIRGNVVINSINRIKIQDRNAVFLKKLECVKEKNTIEKFDYKIPLFVFWKRFEIKGQDYYSAKTCDGIFKLDRHVHIPLTKKGKKEFDSLHLKKYVTVCGGNGLSNDLSIVSKAWPKDYFEDLIGMIKREWSNITIVQIGDSNVEKYKNADISYLGKEFESIAWVLKGSLVHIDIDGGMVHLASQLGTKCVVLFGPTSIKYLGYSQNLNLCSGICDVCYGLYNQNYMCARNMEKPECMYSLLPESVMSKLKDYMNFEV